MDGITEQLMAVIVPALVSVIGLLMSWGLAELTRFIRTKTKSQAVSSAMEQVGEITWNTVNEIEKSVRKSTEDGALTPAEARELKAIALARIKGQLPKTVQAAVKAGVNSLDDFLAGKVEEAVLTYKKHQDP